MISSRRRDKLARASIAAAYSVLERELGLDRERLSVQLRVGIDEVVERIAPLWRVEPAVSSRPKMQTIFVRRPREKIFFFFLLSRSPPRTTHPPPPMAPPFT